MPKPPFVSACGVTNHSVKDAAAKHGRSVSDVRLAISTNALPARKLGRTWVIRCQDIEAWIDAESIPNAAELERAP